MTSGSGQEFVFELLLFLLCAFGQVTFSLWVLVSSALIYEVNFSYKFTCSSVFSLLGTHGPRIPTTFSSIAEPERPVRLGQGWQGSTKGLAAVTGRLGKPQGPAWGWGGGFSWGPRGPPPSITRLKGAGSSWQNLNAKAPGGGEVIAKVAKGPQSQRSRRGTTL